MEIRETSQSPSISRRLVLCLFVFVASASFVSGKECKSGCGGASGGYEAGTIYTYEYEGTSEMFVGGAKGSVAPLGFKATATVSGLGDCAVSVALSNVAITGADTKIYQGGKILEGSPITATLAGGLVSNEICTAKGEEGAALNIKRGLLSMLQSADTSKAGHSSVTQTDLFGECATEVDIIKTGKGMKVKKSRNLKTCDGRRHPVLPFTTVSYDSELHGSPMFDSEYKSEQSVENGVVKMASSEETYISIPLSTGSEQTKVVVKAKIKLTNSAKGSAAAGSMDKVESITFEPATKKGIDMTEGATKVMEQLCNPAHEGAVHSDSAEMFAVLTAILSRSNKATMTNLLNKVKSGGVCGHEANKEKLKKIVLDAISQAHSSESAEMMIDMLKSNEVSGPKARMWYIGLGMVDHVSSPALKAAMSLLKDDSPAEAYIGVGALVGKYCRDHQCHGKNEVQALEKKLAAQLLKGCNAADISQEDKLIASIKGLGNTHYLSNELVNKLIECASDKHVRSRVRVAALEAMHTDPNKDQIKKAVISILKDTDEDSEIRIKAYQVLVECPCPKTAAVIQSVIDSEVSDQVGSYIASHLRNIAATVQPSRTKQREHFGKIKVPPLKFPFNPRYYSTNGELSYIVDSVNVGASGESDIIYSQKSWLPRSVALNLTTQMFGTSINILEVDARAENLERMIEHIFGPNGYANTKSANEVTSEAQSMYGNFMGKLRQSIRPKRGVPRDQIESFASKVDMGKDAKSHDPTVDVSLKMHGSEVGWFTWHGMDSKANTVDDVFGYVDSALDKIKSGEMDYTKHAVVMDSGLEIPTAMGLPLQLLTKVTSAVRVKLDAKIDIPAIMKDPKNAIVRFQLIPSAAVHGHIIVSVDGQVAEVGVAMTAEAHSSTGSDFTARILDGKGVDVKVGLPVAKQDLISANTKITPFTLAGNRMIAQPNPSFTVADMTYSGCFDQVSELLGLTFCGQLKTPWEGHKVLLPIYGPSTLDIHIEKEDPSINAFHFKALYTTQKDTPQRQLEIFLDTPNSKKERRISLNIENAYSPDHSLKVDAHSPWGDAKFEGSIISQPGEHSVNADLNFADQEYMLKAGVKGAPSGGGVTKYTPFLEYKAPEKARSLVGRKGAPKQSAPVTVTGDVLVEEKGPMKRKFTFNSVKINTGRQEFILDGTIEQKGKAGCEADLKLSYDKENIAIKGFSDWKEEKNGFELKRGLSVIPSQYADLGININWNMKHYSTPKALESLNTLFDKNADSKHAVLFLLDNELSVVHGPNPDSDMPKVTIKNHWHWARGDPKYDHGVDFQNSVSYPLVSLSGTANMKVAPNQGGYLIEGQFDKYRAGSSLQLKLKGKRNTEYEMDFNAGWMNSKLELTATREEVGDDKSKYTHALELIPGGKYTLDLDATHKIHPNDVDVLVYAKATVPEDPKTIEVKVGVKDNNDESNGVVWLQAGPKNLIDASGKLKKGSAPQGSGKVMLPGIVESDFNFNTANNVFDSHGHVLMVKSNKKLTGKARLSLGPQYQGNMDLCADNKCMKLTTNTALSADLVETSNNLEWNDLKFSVKGKSEPKKGALSGSVEGGSTTGRHVKASYAQNIVLDKGEVHLEGSLEDVEKVGQAKPRRFEMKVQAKHIDPAKASVDGQVAINFADPSDNTLNWHGSLKNLPANDKHMFGAEVSASGTLVPNGPIESRVDVEIGPGATGSWQVKGKAQDVDVTANGKLTQNSLNNDLAITSPALDTMRWTTVNNIDSSKSPKVKSHNTLKWAGDHWLKGGVEVALEDNGASYKFDWEGDRLSKRSLQGNAHYKHKDGKGTADGKSSLTWEGKKAEIMWKGECDDSSGLSSISMEGTTLQQTPFNIQAKGKMMKPKDDIKGGFEGDGTATLGSDKYTGSAKVILSENRPVIDLKSSCPHGDHIFKWKVDKVSDKHWKSEYHIKTLSGEGKAKSDINFEDSNQFKMDMTAENSWLKLKGIELKTKIDPDKQVVFSVKNDGQPLASGKVTYNVEQTENQVTVKGNGNFNYQGKDHKMNYNAHCEKLQRGGQCSLEAKTDKHSLNLDTKYTPTEYYVKRKWCDEKCSEAVMESKIDFDGPLKMEYKTKFYMDASLFNKDMSDIEFNSYLKRDGINHDQKAELILSPQSTYKMESHMSATGAGWSVSLGKRTVAGELLYTAPKSGRTGGKIEASLWMDKQRSPDKKLHGLFSGESGQKDQGWSGQLEAKVAHPAMNRPISLKAKSSVGTKGRSLADGAFELDVLNNPANKVNGNWKVTYNKKQESYSADAIANLKSEGLGLDIAYESKGMVSKNTVNYLEKLVYTNAKKEKKEIVAKVEIKPQRAVVSFKLPDQVIFEYIGKLDSTENSATIQNSYNVIGERFTYTVDFKRPYSMNAKFTFGKGCDGKAFTDEAVLTLGKNIKWSSSFDAKSLAAFDVSLQEDSFLKPQYKYDVDNIKSLWKCVADEGLFLGEAADYVSRKLIAASSEEAKARSESWAKEIPNYDNLISSYRDELLAIQDEIMDDSQVQLAMASIKKTISPFVEQAVVLMEEMNKLIKSITDALTEAHAKLSEALNEVIPKISASLEQLAKATAIMFEEWLNFCVQVVDIILDQIKAHQDDIKAILDTFTDAMEEMGKVFGKVGGKIFAALREFINENIETLNEMPLDEMLKEQFNMLKETEWDFLVSKEMLTEMFDMVLQGLEELKESVPTAELKQFITTVISWIQKVIRQEPVDHAALFKQVTEEFAAAAKPLASTIAQQLNVASKDSSMPTMVFMNNLKSIRPGAGVRVSLIYWLLNNGVIPIGQLFFSSLPPLRPEDWVPPIPGYAYIIGGSEIITFDGKHFNIGGDCDYLLTKDFVDGNFSVVASVRGGKLVALQINDHADTIELRHGQKPLANGAESEFPVRAGKLKAWRRPTVVGVRSKNGVKILCAPDCSRCKVSLNGFYFAKVRGIMGTFTNEKFDDLTVPSGKIVKDTNEFVKEWTLGSCAASSSPEPNSYDDACKLLDSPEFKLCHLYIKPEPYLAACTNLIGKGGDAKSSACNVATVYAYQCLRRVPAMPPLECVKCSEVQFGDTVQTNAPYTRADVVFAIEQEEDNKDTFNSLILPLVPLLKADFAQKGINDVKFAVVGFGGKGRGYPLYYTKDGSITGDAITSDVMFSSNQKEDENSIAKSYHIVKDLIISESGMTNRAITYADIAENYDWRVKAAKTVIGVHSSHCVGSDVLGLLQHGYFIGSYNNYGIVFNVISPVTNLTAKDHKDDILAFDNDHVYLTSDAKMEGDKGLEDSLDYSNDVCFTFAKHTGGAIFNSPSAVKSAKQVSLGIANHLPKTDDDEYDCGCAPRYNIYDGFYSKTECSLIGTHLLFSDM